MHSWCFSLHYMHLNSLRFVCEHSFFLLVIPLFSYQIYTTIQKDVKQSDHSGLSPFSPWLINPLTWYFSDTERLGHLGIFISALMMWSSCWQLACVKRTSVSASAQLWVCWRRLCSAPNLQENCRCHLNINKPSVRNKCQCHLICIYFLPLTHVSVSVSCCATKFYTESWICPARQLPPFFLSVILFHLFHPLWQAG